jgi:hypothetical protein
MSVATFVFDEDDLTKTQALGVFGLLKHLHLVVPAFTNVVTATVTITDSSGRILWTSAAKAKGTSYNLESETEWIDQVIAGDLTMKVTVSGVAGGSGGTVTAVLRYLAV